MNIFVGYFISIVGGGILVALVISGLRKAMERHEGFEHVPGHIWWLPVIIGFVERTIVTTLLVWAPTLTPGFIGGWILLKFAGGWGRFKEPTVTNRAVYMIALLASVASLAMAIFGGLMIAPDALYAFSKRGVDPF